VKSMTERTLEKAIKIKRQIDTLRTRKAEVKKVWVLCKEAEENKIIFHIQAQNNGYYKEETTISAQTAKLVLDKELEAVETELETLLYELSDLH